MSSWDRLAELPVEIEKYSLEPLEATVSREFERKSTVVRLQGAGEDGLGEDVTYDGVDHDILQAEGPTLALTGRFTLSSFAEALARLELFPRPPQREVYQRYRTWAYESAALDLALRQARTSLHEALLFEAGVTNRLGSVPERSTVSDADPDEQARQMSISATLS